MNASLIRELILYRYRYVISYSLFAVLLIGLSFIDLGSVPYGISNSEMNSAVASNSLNPYRPQITDIVNLPYHLLQKLSIGLLGLSALSIKLPSVILAIASGIVMMLMLRLWFRHNVATLTLLISIISVPFISMARTGTAGIFFVFVLLVILYAGIRLTQSKNRPFFWKVIVFIAMMLLLYVPFGFYTVLALAIAGVLHPHIRFQMRRTLWWQWLILASIAIILIMPHILAGFSAGGAPLLRQLVGLGAIKATFSPEHLQANVVSLVKTLFFFSKSFVGEHVTPFFNMTLAFFIAFGLIKVFIDHSAARSYFLLIWLAFCTFMLLIDTSQLPLLFVPCVLLIAIGVETMTIEWYRLFPRNPYARIGAIIPLGLIVVGLLSIAVTRYFYAYNYTDTRLFFHPELPAIHRVLTNKPTQLVVPNQHIAFYDILRAKHKNLIVTDRPDTIVDGQKIVLANAEPVASSVPVKIVTSHLKEKGVLLRVYETK